MIAFMAGLPRSGSSLLAAMLRQNPEIYVSPTSDLVEALVGVRNNWATWDGFRAQGLQNVAPRIRDMMYAMLRGFYGHYYTDGDHTVVIDKNRAWPAYIEMLEDILDQEVKIICPVRDLRDVCASFERLRHQNPLTAPHGQGADYISQQTVQGRVSGMLSEGGVVGLAARRLRDAMARGKGSRLTFVPYNMIVHHPDQVCMAIQLMLGVKPSFTRTEGLEGADHPNDMDVYGLPLHDVGDKLDAERAKSKWEQWLPAELGEQIEAEFPVLQQIARGDMIVEGVA